MKLTLFINSLLIAGAAGISVCTRALLESRTRHDSILSFTLGWNSRYSESHVVPAHSQPSKPLLDKMVQAAESQVGVTLEYDPQYEKIDYPNGDVPISRGVCADVIIRAYRGVGIDLQKLVHLDMEKSFSLYPRAWGLKKTDSNIDHRRVLNLMVYFSRFGKKLSRSDDPRLYTPGDLVTWMVNGKLPHIGIISSKRSLTHGGWQIVHNIGQGAQIEDRLFEWPITGHFRFEGVG